MPRTGRNRAAPTDNSEITAANWQTVVADLTLGAKDRPRRDNLLGGCDDCVQAYGDRE